MESIFLLISVIALSFATLFNSLSIRNINKIINLQTNVLERLVGKP